MSAINSQPSADFKASNMAILKKTHPDLFRMLDDYVPKPIGSIIETKTMPSIELHMPGGSSLLAYNLEDPWKDVEAYLDIVSDGDSERTCVFIGMGLGYGPLLILEKRQNIPHIVILEPSIDLFYIAMQTVDLSSMILSPKVTFFVGTPDWDQYTQDVRPYCHEGGYLLLHAICIAWAPEIYEPVRAKAEILLYSVSSSVKTLKDKGPSFFENRFKNLTLLRHCQFLDTLNDVFNGCPAILVSAGPSLTKSLPVLKKAVGRCIIIAVDSALAPLLHADICPDFVTATDNIPINYEKVAPFASQKWPFCLVANLSVNPMITKRLMAENLVYAFEKKDEPHTWISSGLGIKTVVPSGSSVVHLSLGLAQVMGADPIVFVGHDFAYTSDQTGHAAEVVIGSIAPSPSNKKGRWIVTNDIHGGHVKTQLFFLEFKTFFEEMIKYRPRTYLNATTAGAHIEGAQVVNLETVLNCYLREPVSVGAKLKEVFSQTAPVDIRRFIREEQHLLLSAQEKKNQIEKMLSQIDTVQKAIKASGSDYFSAKDINGLPSGLRIETEALIRSAQLSEISPGDELQQYISELVGEAYVQNEKSIRNNEKKLGASFIAWFEGELARLESINQTNLQALKQFAAHLEKLLKHLSREGELIRRDSESGKRLCDLLVLVDLYIESDNLGVARDFLDNAVICWPDSSEVWFRMGVIQAGYRDYKTAIASWNKAQYIDPGIKNRVEAARNSEIRNLLKKLNKYRHRILRKKLLNLFLIIAEGRKWAINDLSDLWSSDYALMEKKLTQGEVAWVEQCLFVWEDFRHLFSGWYVIKAKCFTTVNDINAAVNCMKIVVSLEPDNPEWHAILARYSFIIGENDQGVLHLQKAVSIDPQKAELWEKVGDSLFASKNFASAAAAYQECISALPERTEILWKIGDCYIIDRLPHQARVVYSLLLKRDSKNAYAKDRLSQANEMIREFESNQSICLPPNK